MTCDPTRYSVGPVFASSETSGITTLEKRMYVRKREKKKVSKNVRVCERVRERERERENLKRREEGGVLSFFFLETDHYSLRRNVTRLVDDDAVEQIANICVPGLLVCGCVRSVG